MVVEGRRGKDDRKQNTVAPVDLNLPGPPGGEGGLWQLSGEAQGHHGMREAARGRRWTAIVLNTSKDVVSF